MRDFVPFLCFLVIAISGMLFGVSERRGPAANRSAPSSPLSLPGDGSSSTAGGASGALRMLADFYGHEIPPVPGPGAPVAGWQGKIQIDPDNADGLSANVQVGPPPAGPRPESPSLEMQLADLRSHLLDAGHSPRVHMMIALVSDPIESSADHTDPHLDAIQRAFEAEGFLIDQHELIWPEVLTGRGGGGLRYRREPGLLLFRRLPTDSSPAKEGASRETATMPEPELFLVFVVGETPIDGIHKPALHRAIDFMAAWRTAGACGEEHAPIRVLGPTYSGSALSLKLALREWVESRRKSLVVEILSGSATASTNKQYLEGCEQIQDCWLLTTFHAMYLQTGELFETFYHDYLESRLGVDDDEIVLLREGNTSYGESLSREIGHSHRKLLTVTYPLQIGRLRTAYQQGNLLGPPAGSDRGGPLRGVDLEIGLNPLATDLPPAMSPSTAAHLERVVLSLLDAIRRENRRYVGLLGSSVEDRLFLAQLLYYRCPDVHLFALDNNLLYLHPSYNRYLEGMLVASPYPLYPTHHVPVDASARMNGRHSASQSELTLFSSDDAYGAHLACRAVVRRTLGYSLAALHTDYTFPIAGDGDRGNWSRPPVWVVQIGHRALAPLAVLRGLDAKDADLAANAGYTLQIDDNWEAMRVSALGLKAHEKSLPLDLVPRGADPASTPPDQTRFGFHGPSPAYRTGVALFSLFIALLAIYGLAALFRPRKNRTDPDQPMDPKQNQFDADRDIQLFWLAIALLGMQLTAAAPVFIAPRDGHHTVSRLDVLTMAVSCLAIVAIPALLVGLARTYSSKDYRPRAQFRTLRVKAEVERAQRNSPRLRKVLPYIIWCRAYWETHAAPSIAVGMMAATAVALGGALTLQYTATDRILLAEQAGAPGARLFPLTPILICLLGGALVLGSRLLRAQRNPDCQHLLAGFRPVPERSKPPLSEISKRAAEVLDIVDRQASLPRTPRYVLATCALALVLASIGMLLLGFARLTILPSGVEWALRLGIAGLAVLAIAFLSGSEALRKAINQFLATFHVDDWQEEFGRLPENVQYALKQQLFAFVPTHFRPRLSSANRSSVVESIREFLSAAERAGFATDKEVDRLQKRHSDLSPPQAANASDPEDALFVDAGLYLEELIAKKRYRNLLQSEYRRLTGVELRRALTPLVAGFTLYLLGQLCRRLLAALFLVILLMLVLHSYPFQPLRLLLALEWSLIGAAALVALHATVSLNRNATLSAMCKTHEGLTLDWKLVLQTAVLVGLPALTVLSIHFPQFADLFGSAADAVQSVKL